MAEKRTVEATILGAFICVGLIIFGSLLANTALNVKALERTVTVKGLAEREVTADTAIWPITFNEASNDLAELYGDIEHHTGLVLRFLQDNGFADDEITLSQPAITDRQAQQYGDTRNIEFRYTATATVTVYSRQVELVRTTMRKIVDLGKEGIAITGQDYQNKTEFIFTGLNGIKPEMVEEATLKAREVALKFAKDSNSSLGKIKAADQGQFSIADRDASTPHIKKVRVVSTIVYYLSD